MDEMQYLINRDSVLHEKSYLDTPFTDAHLNPVKAAANTSKDTVRVKVEWMCKEVKVYWCTVDFK